MADREHAPDPSAAPALRASDAERERAATLLREHCAAGRLTPEELAERLDGAYAARTVGELAALVADLPATTKAPLAPRPSRSPAREQARLRVLHVAGQAVLVSAVCIAIWLAAGAESPFWPEWVVLGMAIRLAFVGWSELGPGAGHDETQLGRGGAQPREVRRGEPHDR